MKRFAPLILFSVVVTICSLLFTLIPLQAQDVTPTVDATATPYLTPTPIPRPIATTVVTQDGVTLELYFTSIAQGQIGLLHVSGEGIVGARASFLDKLIEFFPVEGDGFFGLLSVNMEQNTGNYDLTVYASLGAETHIELTAQVQVIPGDFIRQDITIAPDRAYLIDPQIERGEFARLESLTASFTTERQWNGATLELPIASATTSPFGAVRILNSIATTRHTGWDLRAAVGTPVMAMTGGTVVFAGLLDIRGNYIMIDHGYGVFSGYAHLSQIHVTQGQSVSEGQIIGMSGDTGRSNGPHLHWEMTVNGEWVDSVQFMQTWLP